jgi:hypothetical protein
MLVHLRRLLDAIATVIAGAIVLSRPNPPDRPA